MCNIWHSGPALLLEVLHALTFLCCPFSCAAGLCHHSSLSLLPYFLNLETLRYSSIQSSHLFIPNQFLVIVSTFKVWKIRYYLLLLLFPNHTRRRIVWSYTLNKHTNKICCSLIGFEAFLLHRTEFMPDIVNLIWNVIGPRRKGDLLL